MAQALGTPCGTEKGRSAPRRTFFGSIGCAPLSALGDFAEVDYLTHLRPCSRLHSGLLTRRFAGTAHLSSSIVRNASH